MGSCDTGIRSSVMQPRSIGTRTVWDLEQRQLRGCFRVLHNDTNRTTLQRQTEIVVAEEMRCSPATESGGEKGSGYEAGQRFSQAQTKDYLTSRLIVKWYSLSLIGFVNALEVFPLFVVTIYWPKQGVLHGRGARTACKHPCEPVDRHCIRWRTL